MLLVTNVAWGLLRPLRAVPHTAQPPSELTKAAMNYKIARLKEDKQAPDLTLMGSSLPMCAFFYAECPPYFDLAEGLHVRGLKLNLFQAYPRCGYLTHKLKTDLQKDTRVYNFTGAACMVSDARVILDRCIAEKRAPKVIVYGLGLRDFVDNVNPPPGETPIYAALADMSYLLRHLSQTVNLPAFPNLIIGTFCNPYLLRNEFRLAFEHSMCATFHRPSTIDIMFSIAALNQQMKSAQDASILAGSVPILLTAPASVNNPALKVKTNDADTNERAKKAASASANSNTKATAPNSATKSSSTNDTPLAALDYFKRYNPANYRHLEKEVGDLEAFVARCHEKGIQLVLVNMPVSSGHLKLSPPGLRERYLQEVRRTAKSADLYIDYEDRALFSDRDFFDTVHLNPDGARKFIDDFTIQLKQSQIKL